MKREIAKELIDEFRRLGALEEAEKSLRVRFTEAEIDALLNIFWLSDQMTSIRKRIVNLERK